MFFIFLFTTLNCVIASVHSFQPVTNIDSVETVHVPIGDDALLLCSVSSVSWKVTTQPFLITWWYIDEFHRQIGNVNLNTGGPPSMGWSLNGTFALNAGNSSLTVKNARREVVERYICVIQQIPSGRVLHRHLVKLRLSFSCWFDGLWSLFYGSLISSGLFSIAFILLSLLWIALRNLALWWIKRLERHSRVRAMISAVEKYKQKQMDALHETYHHRVSTIRSNYHSQLEQLRQSYTSQSDRLREWGQGQRENVQQHLDYIRDNYTQQLSRMREFGSRRMERITEGYECRMNMIRTFTLQQRLRICNQYKVKQRYVNKLLEAITVTGDNSESIRQKEAEIRAVLETIPSHPSSEDLEEGLLRLHDHSGVGANEPLLVATKLSAPKSDIDPCQVPTTSSGSVRTTSAIMHPTIINDNWGRYVNFVSTTESGREQNQNPTYVRNNKQYDMKQINSPPLVSLLIRRSASLPDSLRERNGNNEEQREDGDSAEEAIGVDEKLQTSPPITFRISNSPTRI